VFDHFKQYLVNTSFTVLWKIRKTFSSFNIEFINSDKDPDFTEHFIPRNARFRGKLEVCIPEFFLPFMLAVLPKPSTLTVLYKRDEYFAARSGESTNILRED